MESVSRKALERARPLLEEAGKKLLENKVTVQVENNFEKSIIPGDSLVVEFALPDHALNHLSLEMEAKAMPQALRSAVLKVSFDGYETIWSPVGEFFGTGYCQKPHRNWMNQVDENGKMESFWIMPFRERCTLTIKNYGSQDIHLKGSAGLTDYRWKPGSMYFGASWHEYYNINTRDENGSPFDLNFIEIRGKGVYAGDQVTLFNNTYKWWGEGDEKIFVDGESFPSSFGTGIGRLLWLLIRKGGAFFTSVCFTAGGQWKYVMGPYSEYTTQIS